MRALLAASLSFALVAPAVALAVPLAIAPPDQAAPLRAGPQAAGAPEPGWDWLLPLKFHDCGPGPDGRTPAQAFFGANSTSVLPGFAVTAWKDSGTLYTELVRDTGACAFQLALGAAVSKAEAPASPAAGAASPEAVQRLLAAGSNLVLRGDMPLLYRRLPTTDRNTWGGVFFAPRLGLDVPAVAQTRDFAGSVDLGLEAQGTYTTDQGKFTFYLLVRTAWVAGTRNWADGLGLRHRSFAATQAELGISVAQLFTVSLKGVIDAPRSIRDAFPGALLSFSTGAELKGQGDGKAPAPGGLP